MGYIYNQQMKLKLILICFVISIGVNSLYSPYYKRCRLTHSRVDSDAIPLQDLQVQRIPHYYSNYYVEPVIKTQLQLQYEDFKYFYHQFVDAGGSGEVYLVEDYESGEGKIVKRFFQQKPSQFRRQNYIMKKLNYTIKWAKDCSLIQCQVNKQKFSTLSIYPYKQSIVLRTLQFDGSQVALIFYKILRQLEKTHKAGIIHDDMKMGNIMVNSIGPNFKFYQIQLIDWNLASFYYTGLDVYGKKGTICYYSPQQLFRSYHITPAIDVWALGIVMYAFYTDSKPFSFNCKTSNLRAIASLVGGKRILNMYKKYRYSSVENLQFLQEIENKPDSFPQRLLQSIVPKINDEYYTKQLIQVFKRMFQPDPQLRATPQELMQMEYFKKMKNLPQMYVQKNKRKMKKQQKSQQKQQEKNQKSSQKQKEKNQNSSQNKKQNSELKNK